MKQKYKLSILLNLLCGVALALSPLAVVADGLSPPESPVQLAPVLITEVKTGGLARADEFIELYNNTDQPLDVSGLQLRYITASVTSTKTVEDPSATISLTPQQADGASLLVPPHGYYVLYAGASVVPGDVLKQQFTDLLPATGGSLVLVQPDAQTCTYAVLDAFAWGATGHLFGQGTALLAGTSSSKDKLFERYVGQDGTYVNTGNNAADFASLDATTAEGSIGMVNTGRLPVGAVADGVASQPIPPQFVNTSCTPPSTPGPASDPVPDPPAQTDPNPLPEAPEPAQTDTVDPQEDVVDPTQEHLPLNAGLTPPVISELLPDPAEPQTDAADEFVELYNPNDAPFDLEGYTLEVGTTTKHQLVFAAGAILAPHSYTALFSADTGLSLSNSGGQARLLDPAGLSLHQTEAYPTAKESQAWALIGGTWQWTAMPTPNVANTASSPVVAKVASATTKVKASAKVKTTKASATKLSKTPKPTTPKEVATQNLATTQPRTMLHPGVLALVGGFALLYGAYEYRRDVANKFYQLRSNRAARRALRQSAKGR